MGRPLPTGGPTVLALFLLLWFSLGPALCPLAQARGDGDPADGPVGTDAVHRVLAGPVSSLPVLVPGDVPVPGTAAEKVTVAVTIDLYQPVGSPQAAHNMALAFLLFRESRDVRLVYHFVPSGNTQAERGALILWEALQQDRFWPACELLYRKPDLLLPDRLDALGEVLGKLGLSEQAVRDALRDRRHVTQIQVEWQRQHESVRFPPELWVNGKPYRGLLQETALRTAIEEARELATEQAIDKATGRATGQANDQARHPLSGPPGRGTSRAPSSSSGGPRLPFPPQAGILFRVHRATERSPPATDKAR